MARLSLEERRLGAVKFLQDQLTSRERVLVAAYSIGFSPSQVAKALEVTPQAVTQMARRIKHKADRYWCQ